MASPSPHDRFSLLLLSDGEVLLDDVAADHAFVPAARAPAAPHPHALAARTRAPGRLKVGSHALFFDADDWRYPVVRVPYDATRPDTPSRRGSRRSTRPDRVVAPGIEAGRRVTVRHLVPWRWSGSANSSGSGSNGSAYGGSGHGGNGANGSAKAILDMDAREPNCDGACVTVRASRAAFLRERGVDHPYVEADVDGTHLFYPKFAPPEELRELLAWLQRVNALPSRKDRDRAIREAVLSREAKVPFDIAWLEDASERTLLDEPCSAVYALSRAPGRVRVTSANIYFMPIHGSTGGNVTRISLARLLSVRRMRHGVCDAALELSYAADGVLRSQAGSDIQWTPHDPTLMLSFRKRIVRERAVELLIRQAAPRSLKTFERAEVDAALHKWRAGDMSNFQYLMFLNLAAGRSFNDLSQYPVFPWVVADYTSETLDLSDPATFRDLMLPIGALDPSRRAFFEERYREMSPPRFHYGTHYSTPAYVINYVVRAAPAAMLRLQNGRFDSADRMFNSIAETWRGVSSNQADVKELIPEFYAVDPSEVPSGMLLPNAAPSEFLENILSLDLGVRQDGKRVGNVELPPWANGRAEEFLEKHRDALECLHVSYNIHHWIDLIFGVNARNPEACNVFYTDVVNGDGVNDSFDATLSGMDDDQISQLETVLLEFGRTPQQLFQHPHPPRFGTLVAEDVSVAGEIVLGPPTPSPSGVFDFDSDEASSESSAPQSGGQSRPPLNRALLQRFDSSTGQAGEHPGALRCHDGDRDEADSDGSEGDVANDNLDCMSVSSRATSYLSVSERRTSIAFSPSCAYLSKFKVDGRSVPVLESAMDAGPGKNAFLLALDAFVKLRRTSNARTVTVVTAWSDEHMRVYVDGELRRSRLVPELTCLACGESGKVFFATSAGSISLYSINSGRTELVMLSAHQLRVSQMVYAHECHILVTGSADATIRLWRVAPRSPGRPSLQRYLELDAEDAVVELAVDVEGSRMYVACVTVAERVLAWCVDMSKPETYIANTIPVFDLHSGDDAPVNGDALHFGHYLGSDRLSGWSRACQQSVCWLGGAPAKHMLAVVHSKRGEQDTVRLWKLRHSDMPAAEIALPNGSGATCVRRGIGAGTVFVGGQGCVAEYDRTGLCLHEAVFGQEFEGPVSSLILLSDMSTLVVRVGQTQVACWKSVTPLGNIL